MTAARTKDPVTVKEKESVEFVFTDTTMIVGNSNNTDTLKDL
jgi:hypothetical protein